MSRSSVSTVPPAPLRFGLGVGGRPPSRPPSHPPRRDSAPPTAPHRHPRLLERVLAPSVLVATRDRGSLFRLKRELGDRAAVVPVRSVDQLLAAVDAAGPGAMLVVDTCAPVLDLVELAEAVDTHVPTLPTLIWGDGGPLGAGTSRLPAVVQRWRRLPPSAVASDVVRAFEDLI